MNLVIDIGNTLIKIAYFDGSRMVLKNTFENIENNLLLNYLNENPLADNVIVSCVRAENPIGFAINNKYPNVYYFNHSVKSTLKNAYNTKETLGYDRLASAIGANYIMPNKNLLIINAGTTITYEVVAADATYMGGAISPGIAMKLTALHTYTSKLPLIEKSDISYIIGRSTDESIKSGVINGTVSEIEGFIEKVTKIINIDCIFLSGGDAIFLENRLKNTIFVEPNLVLIGLNAILINNEENN